MGLATLPSELLRNILDGHFSYLVVDLWKCGDRILNAKLAHGGITDLILRARTMTDGVGRWPRMVKFLRLNSLAIHSKSFIGTRDLLIKEFSLLNPGLKRLTCGCDDLFWIFFARKPSLLLKELFPTLEAFIYSFDMPAPFELHNSEMASFPATVTHLTIPVAPFEYAKLLPPALKHFETVCSLSDSYCHEPLPDSVETIKVPVSDKYLQYLLSKPTTSQALRHLSVTSIATLSCALPPFLTSLDLGTKHNIRSNILPPTLLHLSVGSLDRSSGHLKLPEGLKSLQLVAEASFEATIFALLPRNLTSLIVRGSLPSLSASHSLQAPSDLSNALDAENWRMILSMQKEAPLDTQQAWSQNLAAIELGQHLKLPLLLNTLDLDLINFNAISFVLPPLITSARLSYHFAVDPYVPAQALPPNITALALPQGTNLRPMDVTHAWTQPSATALQPSPPLRLVSLTLLRPVIRSSVPMEKLPSSLTSFTLLDFGQSSGPLLFSKLPSGIQSLTLKSRPFDGGVWTKHLPRGLLHCDMSVALMQSADLVALPPQLITLKVSGIENVLSAHVKAMPASIRLLQFNPECDYNGLQILTIRDRLISGAMDVGLDMKTLQSTLWNMHLCNKTLDIHPLTIAKYALQ